MEEKFLAADVEKITGVKRTRLQQWLERGYLKPSIQEAGGHGTRNIYSRKDLYLIASFKRIAESGISRQMAADMLEVGFIDSGLTEEQMRRAVFFFARAGEEYQGRFAVCTPSQRPWKIGDFKETMNDLQDAIGTQPDDMIFVNFGRIAQQIDARIDTLKSENPDS